MTFSRFRGYFLTSLKCYNQMRDKPAGRTNARSICNPGNRVVDWAVVVAWDLAGDGRSAVCCPGFRSLWIEGAEGGHGSGFIVVCVCRGDHGGSTFLPHF